MADNMNENIDIEDDVDTVIEMNIDLTEEKETKERASFYKTIKSHSEKSWFLFSQLSFYKSYCHQHKGYKNT